MATFTEQMVKVIEDNLPKVLLGLVIPATQYGWKLWQDRQIENRKKALRDKITSLSQFRHAQFDATPEALRIQQDADSEYALAIAELARLSSSQQRAIVSTSVPMSTIRRWFLLYIPRRRIAWIPHTLYFIALTVIVAGGIGLIMGINDPDFDPDIIAGFLGLGFYFVLALFFRGWAVDADRDTMDTGEGGTRRRTLFPTIVAITAVLLACMVVLGWSLDDNGDASLKAFRSNLVPGLIGSVSLLMIAIAAWFWRRRRSR